MQDKIVSASKKVWSSVSKYSFLMVVVIVLILFLTAIFRIDSASNTERDEEYYTTLRNEIRAVKYDEEAIKEIRKLVDPKTTIQSNFQPGRNNPF